MSEEQKKDDYVPKSSGYEVNANPFSRLWFGWFSPLLKQGHKRSLEEEDLWELEEKDKVSKISADFERAWSAEKERAAKAKASFVSTGNEKKDKKAASKGNPSLLRALRKSFGRVLIGSAFLKIGNDIAILSSPLFLQSLLLYLQTSTADTAPDDGYMFSGFLFMTSLITTIFLNHYFFINQRLGVHVKAALTATIYRKSVTLSPKAKSETTVGKIVNLMSSDATRMEQFCLVIHQLWSAPIQIAVSIWLIWQRIGIATLAGIAVMIISTPVQFYFAARTQKLTRESLTITDGRIKFIGEMLAGIRVEKFYAWEDNAKKLVFEKRAEEVKKFRSIRILASWVSFFIFSIPTYVAVASFSTYAALGNTLDASTVFSSLALFSVLRFPLSFLPMIIAGLAQAIASLRRINNYLAMPDVNERVNAELSSKAAAIEIVNGEFTYDGEKESVLKDINVSIPRGSLTMVVGEVGSGKTSLLSAILGEADRVKGTVAFKDSVAYVAQEAWIINAKLRDNILFGRPVDKKRYETVLHACALTPDLEVLADGDDTEIGERGINLSGGQKQRISIARALYANEPIVLMDDCLSAVDSHVGKHIFNEAIAGVMSSSTRILATNQLQFLPQADMIIYLKDGRITKTGTYQEFMDEGFDFHTVREDESASPSASPSARTQEDGDDDEKKGKEPLLVAGTVASPAVGRALAVKKKEASTTSIGKTPGIPRGTVEKRDAMHHGKSSKKDGTLVQKEGREHGRVPLSIYTYYFRRFKMGEGTGSLLQVVGIFFFFFIAQLALSSVDLWLSLWTDGTITATLPTLLLVYVGLAFFAGMLLFFRSLWLSFACLRAGQKLHNELFGSVLRLPISFFDATPMGRILNRFSKDTEEVDVRLPQTIQPVFSMFYLTLSVFLFIVIVNPLLLLFFPFIFYAYFKLAGYYRHTSRELKRLDSVSRSPIYAHFSETLNGSSTIRAYGEQGRFITENEFKVNKNIKAAWPYLVASRWLAIRMESISAVIVFAVAFGAVAARGVVSPSLAGLTLTYSLSLTQVVNFFLRSLVEFENQMNAVERIKEYAEKEPEAALVVDDYRPPKEWPSRGEIIIKDLRVRYRPELPPVLKDISISFKAGEKVGIVGRTGAGKSSLMLALFRLVEPEAGSILIDGVEATKLGLRDLRSNLGIVTQDNWIFSGTVRSNIDPFSLHTDDEVWSAINRANLGDFIRSQGGLEAKVEENGDNFSAGQKQELSISRALLKKPKVLVLDEATSAIDFDTDARIQETIREGFKDSTVLTIAHRLNTIMDSDRVLVLDLGEVAEFDTPLNLLNNTSSLFHSMVETTGPANAKYLRLIAEGKISVSASLDKMQGSVDGEQPGPDSTVAPVPTTPPTTPPTASPTLPPPVTAVNNKDEVYDPNNE